MADRSYLLYGKLLQQHRYVGTAGLRLREPATTAGASETEFRDYCN